MHRRRCARALAAAAGLLLAGTALGGCGDGAEQGAPTETSTGTTTETTETTTTAPPAGPTVVPIAVVSGSPRGGIVRETVEKGARVVLVVSSDVSDHVHVHGYDLFRDVSAGSSVRIPFRATLAGRFEVELEDRGVQVAELTVRP